MRGMGILYDYFSADSDEQAGATIDRLGGPGSQSVLVSAPEAPEAEWVDDPALRIFDTVAVKGIDPAVQLGTLEEFLTGRSYDKIQADPRSGHLLALRDEGQGAVVTLTDSLLDALVKASREQLAEVAVPWSQTEEFWGHGDPVFLTDVLNDLAGLARRAQQQDHRLYCWICV
jgi:hypothetical protein